MTNYGTTWKRSFRFLQDRDRTESRTDGPKARPHGHEYQVGQGKDQTSVHGLQVIALPERYELGHNEEHEEGYQAINHGHQSRLTQEAD